MTSSESPSAEHRARRRLPHTWHAFFGRFGRLTDPQVAAIEPVADGRSVVLCAATASGKTEALLGPMIERCARGEARRVPLQIVVVCPTRALCNDFLRRARRPVQACNWTIDVKSGDNRSFSAQDPPNLLVTTPESLDSLLSRAPAVLKGVDGLFLDEIHLLDGGARGDHLRALTWRLKSFRPHMQVCCASATAADARRLASQFCGPDADVIEVDGGRDRRIDAQMGLVSTLEVAARHIIGLVRDEPGCKILVFANTRVEVEWLAAALADEPSLRSFAHHGSLSKAERLRTEKGFLTTSSGVCVATMTLELGIDIGNVDRAVLLNPPPNVASFTQRIGRSNRRGGPIRVSCLYSSYFDRLRFRHMIACAEAGRLFVEPTAFRPTILPQQAVSLMFQNPRGWVSAGALHDRLPPDVGRDVTEGDCRDALDIMHRAGYLHADSHGRFVADEPAKDEFQRGRMHAHIANEAEIEVVDETTGRAIGTAHWSCDERSRAESDTSEGLLLAGKQRKVTRVRDNQVYVEQADLNEDPQFLTRTGPRYSFDLARDLASFVGLADDELRMTPAPSASSANHEWRLEHYFGTLWGRLLVAVMRQQGFRLVDVGPFRAVARYRRADFPRRLGSASSIETIVDEFLTDEYRQLQKSLHPGPWTRFVPEDMLHRWVRECVRPAEFGQVLAGFQFIEADE